MISPEDAAAYPYSPAELAFIERMRARAIVGSGEQVAARLTELAQRLELDELVVVTWAFAPEVRRRSYELLAAALPQG